MNEISDPALLHHGLSVHTLLSVVVVYFDLSFRFIEEIFKLLHCPQS